MNDVFITTYDNPFDYFTQFDEWLNFDRQMGYFTLEYVGRLARVADDMSDETERLELERVLDSILEWNGDMYKKVYSNQE